MAHSSSTSELLVSENYKPRTFACIKKTEECSLSLLGYLFKAIDEYKQMSKMEF